MVAVVAELVQDMLVEDVVVLEETKEDVVAVGSIAGIGDTDGTADSGIFAPPSTLGGGGGGGRKVYMVVVVAEVFTPIRSNRSVVCFWWFQVLMVVPEICQPVAAGNGGSVRYLHLIITITVILQDARRSTSMDGWR